MDQSEKKYYLIKELLNEHPEYSNYQIPEGQQEKKYLLRSLFNIREPKPIHSKFLEIQDSYLQEETKNKGITSIEDLHPIQPGMYLWKGDITTLQCDAIVNAANNQMLGCFCPNHGCIDNAIHTYAGVQLRFACAEIMKKQGHAEETGKAKITSAYNLPCKYVIHTVGPIVSGYLTDNDCKLLESCYRSCLEIAVANHLRNIAFCCISTGEFHFPNDKAAEIAIETVIKYIKETHSEIEVIFNVFKEEDYNIYRELL